MLLIGFRDMARNAGSAFRMCVNEGEPWAWRPIYRSSTFGEQELYDAQGNSFDSQAVFLRLAEGARMYIEGHLDGRHAFPPLAVARSAFAEVLCYVNQRGLHGV
ncbi:MAG: hypothetical protein ACKPKO_16720, partial [Candidatus Fonsibacter sp.]